VHAEAAKVHSLGGPAKPSVKLQKKVEQERKAKLLA
jgi:hypothetical protein